MTGYRILTAGLVALAVSGLAAYAQLEGDDVPSPIVPPIPKYPHQEAMKGNVALCKGVLSVAPDGKAEIHSVACTNTGFCEATYNGLAMIRCDPSDATEKTFFYPIEYALGGVESDVTTLPLLSCVAGAIS